MTDEPSDPCPQCGEEMDGHLALEYEACLRALATTSETGDRVRELADRIVAEGVRAAIEWQQGDQSVTEAECVTATVSALADHGLLAATTGHDRGRELADVVKRVQRVKRPDGSEFHPWPTPRAIVHALHDAGLLALAETPGG